MAADAVSDALDSRRALRDIRAQSRRLAERLAEENASRGHNNLPHSRGEAQRELDRAKAELAGLGSCPPPNPEGPEWKKKVKELKNKIKALEKMLGSRGNSQR